MYSTDEWIFRLRLWFFIQKFLSLDEYHQSYYFVETVLKTQFESIDLTVSVLLSCFILSYLYAINFSKSFQCEEHDSGVG